MFYFMKKTQCYLAGCLYLADITYYHLLLKVVSLVASSRTIVLSSAARVCVVQKTKKELTIVFSVLLLVGAKCDI